MREPRTILVVEDEPSVRMVIARTLGAHGYRVLEAADGEEALDLLDEQVATIELLLTDMKLPHVQGDELITLLRQRQRPVKVICITGHPGTIDVEAGYEYLLKPFTRDQLLAAIKRVLER